ncbi:MAG: hypothetical protein C5B49_12290 [Bdellovibrio sp.]|nr:MAG: hypothetical protein C5B49_12290 [Bdellovibrio sp.]
MDLKKVTQSILSTIELFRSISSSASDNGNAEIWPPSFELEVNRLYERLQPVRDGLDQSMNTRLIAWPKEHVEDEQRKVLTAAIKLSHDSALPPQVRDNAKEFAKSWVEFEIIRHNNLKARVLGIEIDAAKEQENLMNFVKFAAPLSLYHLEQHNNSHPYPEIDYLSEEIELSMSGNPDHKKALSDEVRRLQRLTPQPQPPRQGH